RAGIGYDAHQFTDGRPLVLGGVEIPSARGLLGHSDADVLVHAIADALLGAAALGDIGKHFPDTDPSFKNISSILLLMRVGDLLRSKNFTIENVDSMLVMESPKIAQYVEQMRKNIADALQVGVDLISVKATTNEKMGFVGRGEGAAAQAIAVINSTGE
ncbi:MAG: 2-C-methyl-D-erythritol 2,4-cyclodiphosphate synthase, partial [Ignavibacteriales bacterium]|nr:2-C-methyl-D-erythritol 2,4-cyclodiphosphate synthase [Ignavibacteriales bacterium]